MLSQLATSRAKRRSTRARLDEDEKCDVGIADAIGRNQPTSAVNESGLYSLILTSRKPKAKRFKKWVTAEALLSIRKTGGYAAVAHICLLKGRGSLIR
jgi:prophage antirepressor-like protein